jgi:hypothetical protein
LSLPRGTKGPALPLPTNKAPTISPAKAFDIFNASEFTRFKTEETLYIKSAPFADYKIALAILLYCTFPGKRGRSPRAEEKRQPCQNFASPSCNI